ncbi:hypothetical protein EB118_12480 [bacterium]|nr:hypothetical protein [bacterium]NDD83737.1 hypothetical protein [bacterium]NDG30875.1 hypothetical protein [bacterium]
MYSSKFTKELQHFIEWVKPRYIIKTSECNWKNVIDFIEFTEPSRNKLHKFLIQLIKKYDVVDDQNNKIEEYNAKVIVKAFKNSIHPKSDLQVKPKPRKKLQPPCNEIPCEQPSEIPCKQPSEIPCEKRHYISLKVSGGTIQLASPCEIPDIQINHNKALDILNTLKACHDNVLKMLGLAPVTLEDVVF